MQTIETTVGDILEEYLPPELQQVADPDTAIPELAKNARAMTALEEAIRRVPSTHDLYLSDARTPPSLSPESDRRWSRSARLQDNRRFVPKPSITTQACRGHSASLCPCIGSGFPRQRAKIAPTINATGGDAHAIRPAANTRNPPPNRTAWGDRADKPGRPAQEEANVWPPSVAGSTGPLRPLIAFADIHGFHFVCPN